MIKIEEKKFRVVSGCSGGGGFDLGFKWTGKFRSVCYIERDDYCQALLCDRMREGLLDTAPIWSDFKTFDGTPWRGAVDFFAAGIPCQPHSTAGKRLGAADDRDLWPDMRRIIGEMEPFGVLVENVPGLFINGKGQIINPACVSPKVDFVEFPAVAYGIGIVGELQELGYCVVSFTLSAREVGARHLRERRFIFGVRLADSELHGRLHGEHEEQPTKARVEAFSETEPSSSDVSDAERLGRSEIRNQREHSTMHEPCGDGQAGGIKQGSVSYADSSGCEGKRRGWQAGESVLADGCIWEAEPDVGRVVDGVPSWVDRIRVLGNAVVPQVAYQVAKKVLEIMGETENEEGDTN